jgi:hypothetical protein
MYFSGENVKNIQKHYCDMLIQAYTTLGPTIYSFRAKVDDSDSCGPLVNILNVNKWIKKKVLLFINKTKKTNKIVNKSDFIFWSFG